MDGKVNLWEMRNPASNSSLFIIEKIFEYPLVGEIDTDKALQSPLHHVQSLQFRFENIIAGTRSGEIFFLTLPAVSDIKSSAKESKDLIKPIYTCHDHEIPTETDFSPNSDRIFCITETGLFTILDFATLRMLYRKNFSNPTTAMIIFKNHPLALLAFETSLIVLDIKDKHIAFEIDSYRLKFDIIASSVKVSRNEEFLAVAFAPNERMNTKIEIYNVNTEESKLVFRYKIENINSSIEYMDFSTDNFLLMYKDSIGKSSFFDLSDLQNKDDQPGVEYDIEWMSDGLKTSENRIGLDPCYTEENMIMKLSRVGRQSLIAADEIGTIRLFEYPCKQTGYYQLYS